MTEEKKDPTTNDKPVVFEAGKYHSGYLSALKTGITGGKDEAVSAGSHQLACVTYGVAGTLIGMLIQARRVDSGQAPFFSRN